MKRKLLSILLTFCLAFSLLPTAALADEGEASGNVAKVGEQGYATLQAAINAAKDGDTVTLLGDVTTKATIPAEKTITIDLNGKTLKHEGQVLDIYGNLTIKHGTVELSSGNAKAAIWLNKTAKLTVESDATVSVPTSNFAIGLWSDCTAAELMVKGTLKGGNGLTVNGNIVTLGNKVTVDGATIEYEGHGIYQAGVSDIIVKNANIKGSTAIEVRAGKMTVESGTFTATATEYKCDPNGDGTTTEGAALAIAQHTTKKDIGVTINGGTFNGIKALNESNPQNNDPAPQVDLKVTDGTFNGDVSITDDKNTSISGGTFTSDVSAYVPNGYIQNENGAVETLGETNAVAKVGGTYYKTLADAVAAAQDGDTITLLKDCSSERVNLESKCITIDLNGNTLTSTSAYGVMFCAKNGHKITVNGTKEGSKLVGTLMVTNGTDGHIEINGGTYESSQYCPIYINGAVSSENSTLTVKNATITASNSGSNQDMGCGVYLAGYSTSVFENTTITAPVTGIEIRAGKLALENCTVTGGNGTVTTKANGNGTTVQNAALAISQHTTKKPIDVTINGGTFTGKASVYQTNVQNTGSANVKASVKNGNFNGMVKGETNGTIAVSGGTFTSEVPQNCCAPGFVPKANSDGTHGVKINENMAAEVLDAQGNTVGAYDTLADAITAAKNSETVKLLSDVAEAVTIPADKTITLDLNGKKLVNSENAQDDKVADADRKHTITNNGTLTIKDSVGGGIVDNVSHGRAAIYNAGTITEIKGGKFTRSVDNSTDAASAKGNSWYVIYNAENATINKISGGEFLAIGKFSSLFRSDGTIDEISGGTFTQDGFIAFKNQGTVKKISGGTFSSKEQSCIQNWGTIDEVCGGTITAGSIGIWNLSSDKYAAPGKVGVISGGSISGTTAAIRLTDYDNTPDGGNKPSTTCKASASITGGTITGALDVRENTKLTISGGTFDRPIDSKYCASGFVPKANSDGTYGVTRPSSGSSSSSSYDPTYSVSTPSKTEHGTVTVSPKNASKGDRVTVTVKPDSGYILETLTVTDKNGNELTLKDKGNGKYTFTMPAGKVEVKATFMEDNSMLNFFYDVPNNAYFYEAVKWAVENGITTGVGNDLFAPEQPCTRAQIVTFLWRAAGSPEPKGAASGMSDVVSGSYYEKAVAWAIENGITTGTTTSTFSPDATCTRAQAVTFLARALKAKAASAAEFSDVPTDSYFADAVAWAAANGVTEGIGGGLFGSDNDCTRGQIVTFLYRAYNK